MGPTDMHRLYELFMFGLKYLPGKEVEASDDELSRNEFKEFLAQMASMFMAGKDKVG
jgi:hypothetical protein